MLFSSLSFIMLFLPVSILVYYLVPQKMRNIVLLLESLIFYAWGQPVYVVLLFLSACLNFYCGQDIEEKREEPGKARNSLIFAIVLNVVILLFFKYYGFFMDSVNSLLSDHIPYRELTMPIGISIYTLRAISYEIDLYRNQVHAQRRFVDFALYLSLFPLQLVGPVERYVDMEAQLQRRNISPQRLGSGAMLFICGLAKKVILADALGLLQDQIRSLPIGTFSVLTAWLGAATFAFQFYFELSGMTDMAMGIGRMLGFDFHRSFNYPYISKSMLEFGRRWNITLNTWFREYVYKTLDGAERKAFGPIWSVVLIGALMGLWYGAGWKFLWWGIYGCIFVILERFVWGDCLKMLPNIVQHIYTIVLIFVGWVFFFSPDVGTALDYIGVMFGFSARGLIDSQALYFIGTHWLLILVCILSASARGNTMFQTLVTIPKSSTGKSIAVSVVYVVLFIVSLAFLITGVPEFHLMIQF